MKILLVSDLHYFKPWFDWLKDSAPAHDLLVIAGDLLDQNHPATQVKQVASVSSWLRSLPQPLCVCSGNHDREWNSTMNRWDPPSWLESLSAPNRWTRGGFIQTDELSILSCNYRETIPPVRADVWVTHNPPAGTPVSQSSNGREEGDAGLARHVKRRGPKLLLCGHQHRPARWRAILAHTLCLNPGMNAAVRIPNYVLIDTTRSTAHWQTSNALSVFAEKIETPRLRRERSKATPFHQKPVSVGTACC